MSEIIEENEDWSMVIKPKVGWFELNLQEIWKYRDLILLFVKRDFISVYKQTILGPLWHLIQPLITTIMFTVVFGKLAGLSTDNCPKVLFYMSGIVLWNYFSASLTKTSTTFIGNAAIFGKVYFPRLTVPISVIISNLISFGIQFALFLGIYFYYILFKDFSVTFNWYLLLVPYLIILMSIMGLGLGIIISSMTTKYRDLNFLVSFGVQLLMYATPVIFPLSSVSEKYKIFFEINPLSSIIEIFRYSFLGNGSPDISNLMYSSVFAVVSLFIGILMFNKVEKTFMDTV